jgi:hypothetical protein
VPRKPVDPLEEPSVHVRILPDREQ